MRRHVNAFVWLIEIYVLIHSRIGGNGKQRARMVIGRWTARMEKGDEKGLHGSEREGRRMNEGRVRGWVISFLCLLLIYSDAPRLSASGANKFLESPRQLDTPSLSLSLIPALFPASPFPLFPLPLFSLSPARTTAATRYPAASNSPSAPRRPM